MKTPKNNLMHFSLKIIALLLFVLLTNQGFGTRLDYLIQTNNYTTIVIFAVFWGFSLFVLITTCLQQNNFIRFFWALVIPITTAVAFGFYQAGGSELEVLDVLELWQARHETSRAFGHFQGPLSQAITVTLVGFIIFIYPPPIVTNKTKKLLGLFAWLPLLPIFLFSSLIFIKSDKAIAGLPQQFNPASIAAAISYKLAKHEIPDRKTISNQAITSPKSKHLLYLIDESVNPDYLYSEEGKLLEGLAQHRDKIADFGISISGSNCSARSNAILRLGATRNNLIQSVKISPTIWQYAKKAGYRTVYIDSQTVGNTVTKPNDFQNYMNNTEAKLIDVFYKVKDVPIPELDYRLLELIKKELASDIPTFIYANKNGAHFPYNHNYPEAETIYQPVANNEFGGIGGLLELNKDADATQMIINTYKNAIRWTVDKFFSKFFDEINLNDTVVIYTSDHGQYFKTGSYTHCTSGDGAPATEGLVPMMLMSSDAQLLSNFRKAAQLNYNRSDHFALFSTLLNLFGYSKDIQNQYDASLFEVNKNQNSAFNTGDILGIISTNTIWREVNLKERLENAPNVPTYSNSIN